MSKDKKKADEQPKIQQQAPAVAINSQYIKDLSLEIPGAPEIFREMTTAPRVSINVEVNANHMHDNFFNVKLEFHLEGDINEKKLFILELQYCAVVSMNVAKEHIEPVLMIEIPRLLFPFARSIITSNLTDAGLPPFMISPIDFQAMYQNRKVN